MALESNAIAEAQRLLRDGRLAEAESLYERVLVEAPNNIEALNVVALAALRRGDGALARSLLTRATETAPSDARSWHHLGRVHDALDDLTSAVAAYSEAVRLEPAYFIARLHMAAVLERSGDAQRALVQFSRAIKDAQQSGRWLNAETTAPTLRPLVEHAVVIVRAGSDSLYAELLAPLAARYGREALTRVERCVRIYLGQEPAAYIDVRQRPNFLYFPDLPTGPYFDRALFPWMEELEAQAPRIRAELLQLLASEQGRERVFTTDELEKANLRGLDTPPSWDGYYFYRWGVRREDNCASAPLTAAALTALPLCHIREHGPEVLFSVFAPGTHLLPHRGVTNARSVGHLALMVPEDCALKVGGEIYAWQEGRAVVFDDTYEHEAWNRSAKTRVVLIFDLWNPHLTEPERLAVADLIEAIGDFRRKIEAA
jgi:aspartate beta-hydroxylase